MKAAKTYVLLTDLFSARLDMSRQGQVLNFEQEVLEPSQEQNNRKDRVKSLLATSKPGSEVWIMDDQFFSKVIDLPLAQHEDIDPKHLSQMLAVELEPYCNIPSLESTVSWKSLPNQDLSRSSYWAMCVSNQEMEDVAELVSKRGGALRGLGLPDEDHMTKNHLLGFDEQSVITWIKDKADQNEQEEKNLWVTVEAQPLSLLMKVMLCMALVIVGIGLTQWRQSGIDQEIVDLKNKVNVFQTPARLKEQNAKSQKQWEAFNTYRQRWPELFRLLSTHCPQNLKITQLEMKSGALVLHGVSLDPVAPESLIEAIEKEAKALGWQIVPPRKKALGLMKNQGPWSFEAEFKEGS